MAAYNLNDTVKARLDDRGRAIYREHYGHRIEPETDGFTRMRLWEFMAIFGPHVGIGSEWPFEARIEIEPMP